MDQDQYISTRLEDQIQWYDRKSGSCKKWFHRLKFLEICLALTIPFLGNFVDENHLEITHIMGGIGVIIAAITGFISLKKYEELWVEYRSAAEMLKREKHLFLTKSAHYGGHKAFEMLVETVKDIIAKETAKWMSNTLEAPTPTEEEVPELA